MTARLASHLLISFSLCACGSWRSRPATAWTEEDVAQLLRRSPWIWLEGVRILSRPQDRQGFKMAAVRGELKWLRFTWVAQPVCQAIARSHEVGVARPYSLPGLDTFRFREFFARSQELHHQIPSPIVILVDGRILPELLQQKGGPEMEGALMETSEGVAPAAEVFYGIERLDYVKNERGILQAHVKIEDLKRNPKAGSPVESLHGAKVVREFQDEFPSNQDVHSLLLVFPREVDGKLTVSASRRQARVTIPLRTGCLRALFRPSKMLYRGEPAL